MQDRVDKNKPKGDFAMLWILIAIIFGSVALDQFTKYLTVIYLQPEGAAGSFHLWENVLHLTYVKNPGAAWGMLANHRWVFMTFSTIAIIGLGIYLFGFSKDHKWVKISLAMIIGGGIGNMIDRICWGFVVDFIDFTLINFPVFNVADSFVTVGAGILMVYLIRDFIAEARAAKQTDEGKDVDHDTDQP